MILKTSSMGKRPVYYVQKSYRNEDGKPSNKYLETDRRSATADVANPRPREVGGACRRQVLAGARTQETVGGPNGAQRSELRRTAPPDNNDIVLSQCFPAMSYVSVVGRACMALTMLQGHLTWQRMPFTWWFCYTKMSQMHLHDHVAYPARGI